MTKKLPYVFLLLISLILGVFSLFLVFILMQKHSEVNLLNTTILDQKAALFSLNQNFFDADELVIDLQSRLDKAIERSNSLSEASRGDWLDLKDNEYSIPTLRIGDQLRDFKLISLSPFMKDTQPHSFNAILEFEGSTFLEGKVVDGGDWGGEHVCLELTESSKNKIPIPVALNGYKRMSPVCSYAQESLELLEDNIGKTITVEIEGYSELLCECDAGNDRTIFKKIISIN